METRGTNYLYRNERKKQDCPNIAHIINAERRGIFVCLTSQDVWAQNTFNNFKQAHPLLCGGAKEREKLFKQSCDGLRSRPFVVCRCVIHRRIIFRAPVS